MQRYRVLSFAKLPWILSNASAEMQFVCRNAKVTASFAPNSTQSWQPMRRVHRTATNFTVVADEFGDNFFKRIVRKIPIFDTGKYKRKLTGYMLYEDIASSIDYAHFFQDFKMPDTFYSWFVIMELHVWMLMLRYMAEGKLGHEIRNNIVEAMWADVNARKSHLKSANVMVLKRQVNELSKQFNAAIIGYDEGILSDDKVLAGALWRRFFQCEGNNPVHVETLVAYVRKQVDALDRIPSAELMSQRSTKWLGYKNL